MSGRSLAEQLRGHALAPESESRIVAEAADELRKLEGSAPEIRSGIAEILSRIPPDVLGRAGIV
jgi:hypothetical protein